MVGSGNGHKIDSFYCIGVPPDFCSDCLMKKQYFDLCWSILHCFCKVLPGRFPENKDAESPAQANTLRNLVEGARSARCLPSYFTPSCCWRPFRKDTAVRLSSECVPPHSLFLWLVRPYLWLKTVIVDVLCSSIHSNHAKLPFHCPSERCPGKAHHLHQWPVSPSLTRWPAEASAKKLSLGNHTAGPLTFGKYRDLSDLRRGRKPSICSP